MAKILAPYSLCPLIEHRNFLGIADDALNDCVIVTLSRNMVIRFRLSDRKQLSSWSTSYKLSAPVVYDFYKNRFIGVYNSELVSFWDDGVQQLNKHKKYKFTYLVHSVVSSKEVPPHIVYMNGSIAPLGVDRDSRKQPSEDYISTSENIEDVKLIKIHQNNYVYLATISKDTNEKTLYFIPILDGKEKISLKLIHKDPSVKIVSHTVIESDMSSNLITLWSNGDINTLELPPEERDLPGRLVGNINFINPSEDAALFPISSDQIAIYGAQSDGEGGIVAIYSVKFGVVEASEKLKVCNNVVKSLARPRELIIPSGANLLVIPYKLYTARLAGLIGSQSHTVTGEFEELCQQGVPESKICESLLPQYIDSKNEEAVLRIIENCSDIPDEPLLRSLGFALDCVKETKNSEAIIHCVLKKLLVGDHTSMKLIRTYVPLTSALILLKKLADDISINPGNKVSIEWICMLLDAHYQQYLLSKDPEVIDTIRMITDTVKEQLEYIEEVKFLNWEIDNILKGRRQLKKPSLATRNYIIERIQLY